jgi:predicted phosphodiesterase
MAFAKLLTRIVCISDTHSSGDFNLPNGDILIHAGDLTRKGSHSELKQVLSWLKSLINFRLKIIIAGNHDVTLDRTYYETHWRRFHTKKEDSEQIINMFNDPKLRDKYGIIYLQDQMFIDPKTQLKFYGRSVFSKKKYENHYFSFFYSVHGNLNFVRGHLM